LKDPTDIEGILKIAREYGIDMVMGLSDESILSYEKRFWIASAVVAESMKYEEFDFSFEPLKLLNIAKKYNIENTIIPYLEKNYNCKVVDYSPHLSNRPKLREDLERGLPKAGVLLTELKAAAVDIATREAVKKGIPVIYVNYTSVTVGGDIDIAEAVKELARKAIERAKQRIQNI